MADSVEVTVLVDLIYSYGRGIVDGVVAYARTQRRGEVNWAVDLMPLKMGAKARALSRTRAAGLIVAAGTSEIAGLVRKLGKPAVNISGRLPHSPFPRVAAADEMIGEIGARHLLDLGVKSFAFMPGDNSQRNFQRRKDGFVRAVNAAGYSCAVFQEGDWRGGALQPLPAKARPPRHLRAWLQSLAPQTGLMTISDRAARQVINTCRAAEIEVPHQLAVVGVDLDPLQSSAAGMLLSSVDVNPKAIGFEAARLLDRMLQGESIAADTEIEIEPVGVVSGASTDFAVCGDADVAKALAYIRQHAHRTILVPELTAHVHLSRRVLERRFATVLGRSPNAEIRRLRIEQVKDLLAHTDLSISAIAHAQGFGDVKHLSTAFRLETGCTPTEFRRRFALSLQRLSLQNGANAE